MIFLYIVVFKPAARKLRTELLNETRSDWHVNLACSLLCTSIIRSIIVFYLIFYAADYQFILFVAFTLNIQFGLLFLVPIIPIIILVSPQRTPFNVLVALICLVSHPVLLFVFYWGYQALGLNDWLRILIYSDEHWSSLLWPFLTLIWVPLLCTELGVTFSRRTNKPRIED